MLRLTFWSKASNASDIVEQRPRRVTTYWPWILPIFEEGGREHLWRAATQEGEVVRLVMQPVASSPPWRILPPPPD